MIVQCCAVGVVMALERQCMCDIQLATVAQRPIHIQTGACTAKLTAIVHIAIGIDTQLRPLCGNLASIVHRCGIEPHALITGNPSCGGID